MKHTALFSTLFLCVSAAAGWLAGGWLEPDEPDAFGAGKDGGVQTAPRTGAWRPPAGPGRSSAELAALAAEISGLSPGGRQAWQVRAGAWPPGTAHDLAFALLEPGKHSAEEMEDEADEETVEHAQQLSLAEWAELDPAAAAAAVLAREPGESRDEAVQTVAAVMSSFDLTEAFDFVMESGAHALPEKLAEKWLALRQDDPAAAGLLLERLSRQQRESMEGAFVSILRKNPGGPPAERLLSREEAAAVFQAGGLGTGGSQRDLLDTLGTFYPEVLQTLATGGHEASAEVRTAALSTWAELNAESRPEEVIGMLQQASPEEQAKVLTSSAARVLPALCRAGHITEAVELLERVQNQEFRQAVLLQILPLWIDADPAAARAAFDAAPLTALEREAMEYDPAFLLNP